MSIRTLKDTGEAYPISSNIDGAVYSLASEDCVIADIGDAFTLNYSTNSLDVSFTKGSIAVLCGNAFWIEDNNESITLDANVTAYLCLRIDTSQPNGQKGLLKFLKQAEIKSDNINDSGIRDLPLYIITTSSNGITSVVDIRYMKQSSNNTTITATLTAGSTSISISDTRIKTNSVISFYSDPYGVNPLTADVPIDGKVNLTYDAQTSDVTVGVKVEGTYGN